MCVYPVLQTHTQTTLHSQDRQKLFCSPEGQIVKHPCLSFRLCLSLSLFQGRKCCGLGACLCSKCPKYMSYKHICDNITATSALAFSFGAFDALECSYCIVLNTWYQKKIEVSILLTTVVSNLRSLLIVPTVFDCFTSQ